MLWSLVAADFALAVMCGGGATYARSRMGALVAPRAFFVFAALVFVSGLALGFALATAALALAEAAA